MTRLSAHVLSLSLIVSGCQIPASKPLLDADTFHYQNTGNLHNFVVLNVNRSSGGVSIQNVDIDVKGNAIAPRHGYGEFLLEASSPFIKFYLPPEFDWETQIDWRYDGCAFSVLQRGHFYFGSDSSPTINIAANCPGEPTLRFVYSKEFGLLGFTTSGEEENNTYWLMDQTPLGFGRQPVASTQKR